MVVRLSFSMVVGSDLQVNDSKISIFLVFTIVNTVLDCHLAPALLQNEIMAIQLQMLLGEKKLF